MNHYARLLSLLTASTIPYLNSPATDFAQGLEQISPSEIIPRVTVMISPPAEAIANGGSGVIIDRQGSLYTVLTAWHVVDGVSLPSGTSYTLRTWNGEQITIPNSQINRLANLDLAVIQFDSLRDHAVVRLANPSFFESRIFQPNLESQNHLKGLNIYAGGWTTANTNVQGRIFINTQGELIGELSNPTGSDLDEWGTDIK